MKRGKTRVERPATNRLSEAHSSIEFPWTRKTRTTYESLQDLIHPSDISIVFQPIIDLSDGKLFANEALMRCSAPNYKNPERLFEKAFEESCAGRLGRMVREVAIPLNFGLPLFINIHPSELVARWLVRPDDPIFSHDQDIYLEITESVPFSHFRLCMDVLSEVRARGGIHLVVDDLGAGYSNLVRIADLEPSIVKLDRELVCGIDKNERQKTLVVSIVQLCNDLSAKVVAEGIETESELEAILDTGVHFGQGYLFARPEYPAPKPLIPKCMKKRNGSLR